MTTTFEAWVGSATLPLAGALILPSLWPPLLSNQVNGTAPQPLGLVTIQSGCPELPQVELSLSAGSRSLQAHAGDAAIVVTATAAAAPAKTRLALFRRMKIPPGEGLVGEAPRERNHHRRIRHT